MARTRDARFARGRTSAITRYGSAVYFRTTSWPANGDGYYEEMGRHGFRLAAEHRLASEQGLASLYAAASERFPTLRIALNRVSDAYLFPKHNSPDRLLRQVRDEMRLLS